MKVELSWNDAVIKNPYARLKRALPGICGAIVNKMERIVPVDTGKLKNSLRYNLLSDNDAEISANTHYAIYVEYGTSRMAAQPFMRPSFTKRQVMEFATEHMRKMG